MNTYRVVTTMGVERWQADYYVVTNTLLSLRDKKSNSDVISFSVYNLISIEKE